MTDKTEKKVELTKAGSHVAIAEGYDGRKVVMPGEAVREGIAVGGWMKAAKAPATKAEGKAKADEAKAD